MRKGKCPKVVVSWGRLKKGKLDLKRLQGQWKLMWEDESKISGVDCMTTKLTPYSKTNST